MEVLPPRRASLPKKYIEELRVDTTGYLAGATMKEVKHSEGLYNVQVADHPVPPKEGLKWWPSWFDEVVERPEKLLPVADVRTDSGCALNVKPRSGSGKGPFCGPGTATRNNACSQEMCIKAAAPMAGMVPIRRSY